MANPELVIKISGNAKDFKRSLADIESASKNSVRKMDVIAKTAAAGFAALSTGALISIKNAASFETALVGVGKTTDITGDKLKNLGDEIQKLSSATGFASIELLNIAQSAGQLGVKGSANIIKFTETIAKLGTASDLSGEVAATSLARLINVTQGSIENVDRLASVIVRLGNNFAATESEITFTAQEIAKAGAQFGITAEEVTALGAAFVSLGVQPELARTTILQTFVTIKKAIDSGGKDLEKFQRITGLTGDQLRKTFKEDSLEVFRLFLDGLNKTGDDATRVLGDLGLNNIRLLSTLPTLANGIDIVNDSISQMRDELKNTTALQTEFERQLGTAEKQGKKLLEVIKNISQDIGEKYLPSITSAFSVLGDNLEENRKSINDFVDDLFVGMATLAGIFSDIGGTAVSGFQTASVAIRRFGAELRLYAADFLGVIEDMYNKIPGLGDVDFSGNAQALRQAALKAAQAANIDEQEIDNRTFSEKLNDRLESLRVFNEQAAIERAEARNEQADAEDAFEEERIEKEADNRNNRLELTQEQFEEDQELLLERLEAAQVMRDEAAIREIGSDLHILREKAKNNNLEIKQDLSLAKKKNAIEQTIADQKISLGAEILKAAGVNSKAIFLIQKAAAIAQSIVATNVAYVEALAHPPGPPTTIPIANAARLSGNIATGIIAATAVQGITGAADGGIVQGGSFGRDTQPFLLARDEIIVPSRLNPLSPNFEETFGGAGIGGQNVNVQIGLNEEASRLITVQQREDRVLGVQR